MASFRDSVKKNSLVTKPQDASLASLAPEVMRIDNGETFDEASRGQFRRGFDQSLNHQKKGAYELARGIGAESGIQTLEQFGAEGAANAEAEGNALPQLAEPSITDVDDMSDVLDWALGGLGQLAGSALPTIAAGAAGVAAAPFTGGGSLLPVAGAFLTSAAPEAGHAFRDIEDSTGEQQLGAALATGGAIGAVDTLAVGKLVRYGLPQSVANKLLRKESLSAAETKGVKNVIAASATEGGTEGLQEVIGRGGRFAATGDEGFDPLSEEALNDYINSVALGALGGGAIGTAGSALKAGGQQAAPYVQKAVAALPGPKQEVADPNAPPLRELPPHLAAMRDDLGKFMGEGPQAGAESRGIIGLTEASESGALLEAYQRSGLTEEAALEMQSMTLEAVDLANQYIKNPERAVPPEDIAMLQEILNHPVNKGIFEASSQFDEDAANAGLDEAVATRDDQGSVNTQMQEVVDEGVALQEDDGSLPDNAATLADMNLNLESTDTEYKLFSPSKENPDGVPLLSVEGANRAQEAVGSESRFEEGALEKRIKTFNARNKTKSAEAVPYNQVVEQRARQEFREMDSPEGTVADHIALRKREEANRLWEQALAGKRAVANLYSGPASADSFLSNYAGMKVTAATNPEQGVSDGAQLTADDLAMSKSQSKAETKGAGLIFAMPRNQQTSQPTHGFFDATVEGVKGKARVNAVQLTKLFRSKDRSPQRASERDMTPTEQIADAFYRGVAQLAVAEKGIDFDGAAAFPDSLVIFRDAEGKDTTFGEVKHLGSSSMRAASLEESLDQLRREYGRRKQRAASLREEAKEMEGPAKQKALDEAARIEMQLKGIQGRGQATAKKLSEVEPTARRESAEIKAAQRAAKRAEDKRDKDRDDVQEELGIEDVAPPLPKQPIKRGGTSQKKDAQEGNRVEDFNHNITDVAAEMNKAVGDPDYAAGVAAQVLAKYMKDRVIVPKAALDYARSMLPENSPQRGVVSIGELQQTLAAQAKLPKATEDHLAWLSEHEVNFLHRIGGKPVPSKVKGGTEQTAASKAKGESSQQVLEQIRQLQDKMHQQQAAFDKHMEKQVQKGQATLAGAVASFFDGDKDFKATMKVLREEFDAWTKELGIEGRARLLTPAEAMKAHPGADMATVMHRFSMGNLFGTAIQNSDGTFDIVINPLMDPLYAREQLAHEIGHVFKAEAASRLTEMQARQIIAEYEKWLGGVTNDASVYDTLGGKKSAKARLVAMMGHTSQLRMRDLTPTESDYLLSFDEWFADKVGEVLVNKKVSKATTPAGKALQKLLEAQQKGINKLFGGKYDNTASAFFKDEHLQSVMMGPAREADVWAAVQGAMPDTSKLKFSQEAITDQRDPIKMMDDRVQARLGISLAELAAGQKTMTQQQFRERIMAAAMVGNATETARAHNQLNRVMMTWLLDNTLGREETNVLGRLVQSTQVRQQLLKALGRDDDALAAINDPVTGNRAAIGYLYMFHMDRPDLFPLTPRSRGIFDKIKQLLLDIAGIISDTEQVTEIVRALEAGRLVRGERPFTVTAALRDNVYQQLIQDAGDLWTDMSKYINPLVAAGKTLLNTKVPALRALVLQFDKVADAIGVGKTFIEERTAKVTQYITKVNNIFEGATKEQVEEVKTVLFDYKTKAPQASPEVKRMADETLLLLHDLFGFFQESGVAGTGKKGLDGKFKGMGKRGDEVIVKREDGTEVKVRAYFPWVVDLDKFVLGGAERFNTMLHRPEYNKKLAEMLEEVNNARNVRGEPPITKAQLIDQLVVHISTDNGLVDTELNPDNVGHIPKMTAYSPRTWAWLTESHDPDNPVSQESIADWQSLQQDSMYGILHGYIEQGVKRAIYAKRFGNNGGRLSSILAQAKLEGATDRDIRNAEKYIDSMLGTHGHRTNVALAKAWNKIRGWTGKEALPLPERGKPINNKLQKATQWMMLYQNVRLLDFAVLSSIMDPVGILVRTGSPKMAWHGLKAGFKDTYTRRIKGQESVANSIAEMLGIVENNMMSEALQWNSSGNFMSGRARKINDAFFRFNGLQGWTRMTRIMATVAGQQFMKFHVTTPNQHSERYLQELGLRPGDLTAEHFDAEGNIKFMTEVEYNKLVEQSEGATADATRAMTELFETREAFEALKAEHKQAVRDNRRLQTAAQRQPDSEPAQAAARAAEATVTRLGLDLDSAEAHRADLKTKSEYQGSPEAAAARLKLQHEERLRTALLRFTNEAILRPNASQRPLWASDPHFAVIFHLKQFIWSFHATILGRMAHEAQYGNYKPMTAVPVFMMVMAGADQLREYLKYGAEGNPYRAHWGITDHVWHSMQRAGLTGTFQSVLDSKEDTNYGGFGFESFTGPTVNQAIQALKLPFRDGDYAMKQLDRMLPFNNTRDMTEIANFK